MDVVIGDGVEVSNSSRSGYDLLLQHYKAPDRYSEWNTDETNDLLLFCVLGHDSDLTFTCGPFIGYGSGSSWTLSGTWTSSYEFDADLHYIACPPIACTYECEADWSFSTRRVDDLPE